MSNYTVEDFEKWLKVDKSHQAGLKGWWWILKQIKFDTDLRASLICGNDQGGWNFSDPQWRKKWGWLGENFDDYYQVFLKYKEEVDSQVPNNEEQSDGSTSSSVNNNNKNDNPLTIPEQIIAMLAYWERTSVGYSLEGFLDQVSNLLTLLKSKTNATKKIKALESFLSQYKKWDQQLQPLSELVKKWKEEVKLSEEQTETSWLKNNWPWGKIGLGMTIVFLAGIIWWGGKKVISFF